jgi:hypothetical protein
MKSLMLLNARKRRKSRRSRRSRRNPVGSSKAFRSNFPKSMGRKRRTTRRRRVLSIRRFRLKGGRAGVAVRARKIYVSRRGRKAAIIVARNPRRRRSYRMNPLGGNILSKVKGVFSKENLTIAGGGIAATILTNKLLSMTNLPMPADANQQKLAKIGYAVGIPVLGAMLTRRFSPGLAKGMVFGALINGITETIKGYAPAETKKALGFAEYLDYTPMSAVGATPGYSAINQFSQVRPMNSAFSNSSAFPADAWGR